MYKLAFTFLTFAMQSALAQSVPAVPKIAFLRGNEIFSSNIDGTDLRQLTKDGAKKTDLRWSPDGD